MKTKRLLVYLVSIALLVVGLFFWPAYEPGDNIDKTIKVALREVGNQLLIQNQDSSSIIKPVVVLNEAKFELSFENTLFIQPNDLVEKTTQVFEKAQLPGEYITEVIECSSGEVAYSFKIEESTDDSLIPCSGRTLPESCYIVQYSFNENIVSSPERKASNPVFGALLLMLILLFIQDQASVSTRKNMRIPMISKGGKLGEFSFFPEQNLLKLEQEEIQLSNKECELLTLLSERPNQVIKREELSKRVWEDHGVVVGRSLDTYISKLRKILSKDAQLKIVNVHGVGYKLEVLA